MGGGVSQQSTSVLKDSAYTSETRSPNTMLRTSFSQPHHLPVKSERKEDMETSETQKEERHNLEKKKKKALVKVRSLLRRIKAAKGEISEECEYSDDLQQLLVDFDNNFLNEFDQDVPSYIVQSYKSEICELVEGSQLLDVCCDIIIKCYARKQKAHFFSSNCVNVCNAIVRNLTEVSEKISEKVTHYPEFLETLKQILQDATDEKNFADKFKGKDAEEAMETIIFIIHNLAMGDSSIIARLRSLDFTSVLRPYLKSSNQNFQILSLSALAGIVNEIESNIIDDNKQTVKIQLEMFKEGLRENHRCWKGWSCREHARVVRMLARNDANKCCLKRLLVELGALEVLVKLGQIGDDEEIIESTLAIWTLCFDEENRQKVATDEDIGVVDLLIELSTSENQDIRKNCEGALWTLREELKTSGVERYRNLTDRFRKSEQLLAKKGASTSRREDTKGDHIMISYQWANQEKIKEIAESLRSNNFKVWIDIESMGGSTLEAMARAVEQASVVLVCYSQKYKDSPNCRAEAEYAFKTKKTIVPLKMERGYEADGWLGIMIGTKLFYEFSEKYFFVDKVNELIQALFKIYGRNDMSEAVSKKDQPSNTHTVKEIAQGNKYADSSLTKTTSTRVSMETLEKVRRWEPGDVKRWIEENNLTGCQIDHLTGGEIALLVLCTRAEAPEFVLKTLRTMLNINNFLTMSKIFWALKDLSEALQAMF